MDGKELETLIENVTYNIWILVWLQMPVPPPLRVPILMKCYASAVVFHLEIEKEHYLAGAVEGENISEQARKFKKSLELLLCNLSPHQSPSLLFRIGKGHLTKYDHFSNYFANVVPHHYTADSFNMVIFSLFSFNFPTGGLIIWISFFQDSFYVALIRKPTRHFESVFYGYQIDTLLGMNTTSNPFDEFLTKPRQYLLHYLQQKPRFDININMAKNGNFSIVIV